MKVAKGRWMRPTRGRGSRCLEFVLQGHKARWLNRGSLIFRVAARDGEVQVQVQVQVPASFRGPPLLPRPSQLSKQKFAAIHVQLGFYFHCHHVCIPR